MLVESFCLLLKRFTNPYRYLDMIPRFGQISLKLVVNSKRVPKGRETLTKSSDYAIGIGSSLKIQAN